jgi:endothelin-converting enzyme/putative endopeptidase
LNLYHKGTVADLEAESAAFGWRRYFTAIGAPQFDALNVRVPAFFQALSSVVAAQSLPAIKAYLRWHLVRAMAPYLSSDLVSERFAFYGKTLSGIREQSPRWKRCVGYTDDALGEALGKPYVERTFGAEGKRRASEMVRALEKAFGHDIDELAWMTDATKEKALVKLRAITDNIGYPGRWRDYSAVRIDPRDLVGDVKRGAAFEVARALAKIGAPVDRTEWLMTPPTVNAYYEPSLNNITFPAGILQPPFYESNHDAPLNLGGIGAVIGHELTHGFDDEGRLFDEKGNYADWWTAADAAAFQERARCLVEEYGSFVAVDDVHLNGQLTLGENLADNGGLRIALRALAEAGSGQKTPLQDGFTKEQRLFLSYGQIWCENRTPEAARLLAATDPHAPGQFRVNGVVSNMPEFQRAFGCEAGQPMVREQACRVW